jgi:homoserine O-acetyltransferase/O-succinyltransferase
MDYFNYAGAFELECGETLPGITIAYCTYGKQDATKSNVVWVCHALTANADAINWWPGVIGEGCVINPDEHFIVCANILGSCYGTTGPLSINAENGEPYYSNFPVVTIRDMVKAHILLRQHLGIEKIFLLMGGSMGGYQCMEWAVTEKNSIENIFLAATSATESAWGIAIHATQRLAIEADATWKDNNQTAGQNGLKAARAIGILTYRNYGILVQKQTDTDAEKVDDYKAASYINYQGDKLMKRFYAYSYWLLTKSMDSHHLARGRSKPLEKILADITQPTLIMGINSDILCPVEEQKFIATHLPSSTFVEIDSAYGHDGFLVEAEKISKHLSAFINELIS